MRHCGVIVVALSLKRLDMRSMFVDEMIDGCSLVLTTGTVQGWECRRHLINTH